jgi:hypothetical protein
MPENTTRTPLPPYPTTHAIPPVSLVRLATLSLARTAYAETLQLRILQPQSPAGTYGGNDKRAEVPITPRLLKAATDGLAGLIISGTPAVAGDVRDTVREKLVKMGVPDATAAAIVASQASRDVLTTEARDAIRQHNLEAAVIGQLKLKDGRI